MKHIRSSKTRLIFVSTCGRHQNCWQEAEYASHVKEMDGKKIDIGEPTSCLDHAYLGCTQRECKPNETIIEQYQKMFESRISAGATEKLPGWEKPHAKTVACSYDMEGHAPKCVL